MSTATATDEPRGAIPADLAPRAQKILTFLREYGPATPYRIGLVTDTPDGLAVHRHLATLARLGLAEDRRPLWAATQWDDDPLAAKIAEVDYFLALPEPAHRIYSFLATNRGAGFTTEQIAAAVDPSNRLGMLSWLMALKDHGLVCPGDGHWTAVQCANHDENPHRIEWRAAVA